MTITKSLPPLLLNQVSSSAINEYFVNSWELYECLFKTIIKNKTLYAQPDPLRLPLIFYLGHTAVFYINKLNLAKVIHTTINADYENLFAIGVDPETPKDISRDIKDIQWPDINRVWEYRSQALTVLLDFIKHYQV